MKLKTALRIDAESRIALVGAGGKSTTMFELAREYDSPVLVSTTTHLSWEQGQLADRHIVVETPEQIDNIELHGQETVLVTCGKVEEDRAGGLNAGMLERLYCLAKARRLPLIVEADGSRCLPLKAPADHEPAIPAWATHVVVVAGLSGLDQPLSARTFHRPERMTALTGLGEGEAVTIEALEKLYRHPMGGLKNIPSEAQRCILLNQADTPQLQSKAASLARCLTDAYDHIVVAALKNAPEERVYAAYQPVAAVILAGGASRRLGKPKALLPWRGQPLVRWVAQNALNAGLWPVTVVLGAVDEPVREALAGLPVEFVTNPHWQHGQSESLKVGVRSLPGRVGAAVFLLCDQPQLPVELLRGLVETHAQTLSPVVMPQVDGQRANPVLFDRVVFGDLLQVSGDVGGRAVFSRYPVTWLPWLDNRILLDVDTEEDYQRLLSIE